VSGGIVMSRPMVTIWELSASTVTSRADGVSGPATMVTWVKAEHRRPGSAKAAVEDVLPRPRPEICGKGPGSSPLVAGILNWHYPCLTP